MCFTGQGRQEGSSRDNENGYLFKGSATAFRDGDASGTRTTCRQLYLRPENKNPNSMDIGRPSARLTNVLEPRDGSRTR